MTSAQQRAAGITARITRAKYAEELGRAVRFPALGVHVKDGEVRAAMGRLLGPLDGACAGLANVVPAGSAYGPVAASLGYGLQAGACTTFVAFPGGRRHMRNHVLRHPRIFGVPAVDAAVIEAEIAHFNLLADLAAAPPEAGNGPSPAPREKSRLERRWERRQGS